MEIPMPNSPTTPSHTADAPNPGLSVTAADAPPETTDLLGTLDNGPSPAEGDDAPIIEDISLIDPDTVEFAIFSSGGLDIYSDDGTVTMTAPVLRKLRAFLGLFMEPAA